MTAPDPQEALVEALAAEQDRHENKRSHIGTDYWWGCACGEQFTGPTSEQYAWHREHRVRALLVSPVLQAHFAELKADERERTLDEAQNAIYKMSDDKTFLTSEWGAVIRRSAAIDAIGALRTPKEESHE